MFCRFRTNPVRASCPAAVRSYSGVRNKNKPADVLVEPLREAMRFARENEACTNVEVTADVDGQHESLHAHRGDVESLLTSDLFATIHAFSNTVMGEWSRSALYIDRVIVGVTLYRGIHIMDPLYKVPVCRGTPI